MKPSTVRKIIRWVHIIFSIPIVGMIYGPVAELPIAMLWVQWVFFPAIVLSGLWMWQGHFLRKWIRKKRGGRSLKSTKKHI